MSHELTRFRKPLIRHAPRINLVIRIDEEGVAFRVYRRRKWHRVRWEQLASLADDSAPIIRSMEVEQGAKVLKAMGAKFSNASKPQV